MNKTRDLVEEWILSSFDGTLTEFLEYLVREEWKQKQQKRIMDEIHPDGKCPLFTHSCDGTYEPYDGPIAMVYPYTPQGTTIYGYSGFSGPIYITEVGVSSTPRISN